MFIILPLVIIIHNFVLILIISTLCLVKPCSSQWTWMDRYLLVLPTAKLKYHLCLWAKTLCCFIATIVYDCYKAKAPSGGAASRCSSFWLKLQCCDMNVDYEHWPFTFFSQSHLCFVVCIVSHDGVCELKGTELHFYWSQ